MWYFCRRLLHTAFLKEYGSEPPDLTRTEDEDPAAKHLHEAFRSPTATCSVVPVAFKFFSSARIVEQQGRFTMCLKVHQDHVCIATKIARAHLKKIVIPYKIKPDFLDGTAPDEHHRGRAVPGSRRLGSIDRRADLARHAARGGRTQGLSVNRRRTPVAVGSRSSLQPERTERAIVHDGDCPIVFTGAVARRSDLAVSAQACVDGVGTTYAHLSRRAVPGISLQPVPRNRYQITFMDVPVKTQVPVERPELLRRQSHRRRDAEHLRHGIRLVQKMATPGTATSQGTDFNDIRIFRTPLFSPKFISHKSGVQGSLMDKSAFANACMLTKLW